MARNFKIRFLKNNGNGHLKLIGDFDGTSAHELINFLNDHFHDTAPIPIDTDLLTGINSFGLEVFYSKIRLADNLSGRLMFTGVHASKFNFEVDS